MAKKRKPKPLPLERILRIKEVAKKLCLKGQEPTFGTLSEATGESLDDIESVFDGAEDFDMNVGIRVGDRCMELAKHEWSVEMVEKD